MTFRIFALSLIASGLFAQFTPPGGATNVKSDPSGSCTAGTNMQFNIVNGKLWGCTGTWTQIGSGGGSMTWPSAPGITACTGTPCTAWGTSLAAPSGAIVGTSDSQTLTNKTVDGVTPTVFGYLDPTSSVQTQLNAKAASNASTTVNGQTCTLGSSCTIVLSAINPQTATYQVLDGDFSNYKTITVASGTFTITLVASGSQPAAGQYIDIINYGSGVVTVARSGQNINGGTTSLSLAAGSATAPTSSRIISDGTNYFASTAGGTAAAGGYGYARGTTSGKPACSSTYNGRWYVATDSVLAYGCNGTTDQAYSGTVPVTPPGAIGNYTTVTTAGGTISQIGDAIAIQVVSTVTTAPNAFYTTSAVSPTTSVVTAAFDSVSVNGGYSFCGVAIYSTSGQGLVFGPSGNASGYPTVGVWSVLSADSWTTTGITATTASAWYRWRYVSTTSVVPEMSVDAGAHWFTPQGITASWNPSGFTHQYMGVACATSNGAGNTSVLVTHFTFQ